jgi:hypothetical protein
LTVGIEAQWRTRFGPGGVSALRAALEPLAAGDPPPLVAGLAPYPDNWRARTEPASDLPHYPMTRAPWRLSGRELVVHNASKGVGVPRSWVQSF